VHVQASELMVFDQAQGINDSSMGSTISGVYLYGSGSDLVKLSMNESCLTLFFIKILQDIELGKIMPHKSLYYEGQ
jgi:hypothetical protein